MKVIILVLLATTGCLAQVKISQMPTAQNIDNAWIPIVQDGVNKKVSANLFVKRDTVLIIRYYLIVEQKFDEVTFTPQKKITSYTTKGKKVDVYDISGYAVKDGNQGRLVRTR